jgi:hypothetical protein
VLLLSPLGVLLFSPEPVVALFVVEPLGFGVWFVPAVGLEFDDRFVELPVSPATELHGRPSRPIFVLPGVDGLFIGGLFIPVPVPLLDEPGVAEGLDSLMPPLAPALPPLLPLPPPPL